MSRRRRQSGGNPNQIREYEAMPGRIYDVRFNADGTRFFAASSLDGHGQVRGYETDSGKKAWQLDVPEAAIYAVACSADGATVAAAGGDGQVRLIDAAKGAVRKTFMPVDITPPTREASHWFAGPDLPSATAGTASASAEASTSPNCKSSLRRSASRNRPITCNCSARPLCPAVRGPMPRG